MTTTKQFICPKCQTDQTHNVGVRKSWSKRLKQEVTRHNSYCRTCQNACQRKNYNTPSGKEKRRTWNKKTRSEIKELVTSIKVERGCSIKDSHGCNGIKVGASALDFHHRDPTKKKFLVSEQLRMGGKERILNEISKCEVVCANCHRIIHSDKETT